ncbi:PAS domain S-box-containing protein/diguanylate cyclase (GGDEF) domain-containing protein [Roseateles sp. YR242]|uniref:diguanylate cyclase domain-containing protein n=1 Tax=Roseateles sp. YR242 TaxID=1855305 RepID=UPI0008B8154E|nr:diguanylate cyclase [Roseateles sp. YR242]SEK82707.1 PAS domain S-box-containing protein/diguanylate cyclase (GGDEF) domain-containing protein [Roseateles sp. YR242]
MQIPTPDPTVSSTSEAAAPTSVPPSSSGSPRLFVPARGSRASLGRWLTAVVLSAVAVALLSSAVLIENFARAHAERRAVQSLRQVAIDFRDALDRGMSQQFREIRVLAQLETFRGGDAAAMRRALDQVQIGFDHFAWLGVTDADGKVVAAAGGLLDGVDVSKRPWFQGAQRGPFVGDLHAAVLLERLLPRQSDPWRFVDFAIPLVDNNGQRRGVFGAHLSWSWARQIKSELIDATMASHQADALILGKDGSVILGPSNLEGKKVPVQPDAGAALRHYDFDGKEYFAISVQTQGYGPYPGLGWTVLVRQPVTVALEDYYRLRNQIILSALILLALAVPLSWWQARRLSRPLNQLSLAIANRRHLSEDALPEVGGYREVAVLSHALTELAQRQAQQDASLAQLNASLEERVHSRTVELEVAMQRQEASERRLRTIADNLPVLISYIDADQRLRFLNATFRTWLGTEPEAALGKTLLETIGPVLYEQRMPSLKGALAGVRQRFETRSESNGVMRDLLTEYVPDLRPDGTVAGVYTLSTDVSAFKQVERELDQLSRIDPLTGLPNRRQFDQRLAEALARARRSGHVMALMFMDLDRFKQVNDSLGHAGGDVVLQTFAERVRRAVRETDLLCRLAGDEFVLIVENLNDADEAGPVAQKLLDAVRAPLMVLGTPVELSTSIGIACTGADTESDLAFLARADDALYAAKAAGRGCWRLARAPLPTSQTSQTGQPGPSGPTPWG